MRRIISVLNEILFVFILYLLISADLESPLPRITYLVPIIWNISILIKFYKYSIIRKTLDKNEIRFDLKKQKYIKSTIFFTGLVIMISSCYGVNIYYQNRMFFYLLVLGGFLLTLSGYFYVSYGKNIKHKI
jgi:hypothetical protein